MIRLAVPYLRRRSRTDRSKVSIFDDPGLFGRLSASDYDAGTNPDPAPAVDFLAGLADGGPVLELAIRWLAESVRGVLGYESADLVGRRARLLGEPEREAHAGDVDHAVDDRGRGDLAPQ